MLHDASKHQLCYSCFVQELHELLIDELHKQIYIKSTSSVVKGFQRQGSLRQSKKDKTSLVKQVLTQATQAYGGEVYTGN